MAICTDEAHEPRITDSPVRSFKTAETRREQWCRLLYHSYIERSLFEPGAHFLLRRS